MRTKIFKSGNSLAVRLPKALELKCGSVFIHREGSKIIIEEEAANGWPDGFFESVRISRKDFGREKSTYTEKVL
jgi:virulence-associated protein VagC